MNESIKKIAFINTSTGWGGLELNILNLANTMRKRGFHITLITEEQATVYTNGKDKFDSILLLKNKVKRFDLPNAYRLASFLKGNNIESLVSFENKDLDMIFWMKLFFISLIKVIYKQNMQIGIRKKDLLHTLRFKSIDHWVCPVNFLKKEVEMKTNYPLGRVEVSPLCVDVSKFTPKKYTKSEASKKLNIDPKLPLLGIIGRISPKKGQLFVLEAILNLRNLRVPVELLIFGSATINSIEDQAYEKEIRFKISEYGLGDQVHLVPHQEDVSIFYNAIDIFIMASESETFGMVTVEAMLSNVPVIGTNAGGTTDLLNHGEFGVLYEYNNIQDFCTKIRIMLSNISERESRASKALESAIKLYDQEAEVDKMEALLAQK